MAPPVSPQHPLLADDCPRCGQIKTTFDVVACSYVGSVSSRERFEAMCRCRNCFRSSISLLEQKEIGELAPSDMVGTFINGRFKRLNWVFQVPGARSCPDHVPPPVKRIYDEAAKCLAIGAFDAAGTMFRKVLDAATREKTPEPVEGDNTTPSSWKTYKDLRLRLDWLFERRLLDPSLEDLSGCIHLDGNEAAHSLEGIGEKEALDLADFSEVALKSIYTTPGQIAENRRRRDERRGS